MARRHWRQLWPDDPASHPFPYRLNPHLDDIRAPLLDWAIEIGIAPAGELTSAAFTAVDYAAYPAWIYPSANKDELLLVAQWMTWFFLFDNHLDEQPVGELSAATFALLNDINKIITTGPVAPLDAKTTTSPYAIALIDLWNRSRCLYRNCGWERRYENAFADYQRCQQWEQATRATRHQLDFQTYVENKRCSAASQLGNMFVELFVDHPVPDAALDSHLLRTARHIAGDVIHLATDVLSSERETNFEPIPNALTALAYTLQTDNDQVERLFTMLWQARTQIFHNISTDLPTLMQTTGHNLRHLPTIRAYLDDLRLWMGGNMHWIDSTPRYNPAYNIEVPPRSRTG